MADLELTDKYDEVLLSVPWRMRGDRDGKTWLFKFAPHPERTGYIIVVTDLVSIHYEVIFGPPLPARLRASSRLIPDPPQPREENKDEDEEEDPFEAVEKGLKTLKDTFESGWEGEGVTVHVKEDRTYDLVVHLLSDGFAWIFNLTELRGRRPLSFISRHLIHPLTTIIAQDRQLATSTSASASSDLIAGTASLLSGGEVSKSLSRIARGQANSNHTDDKEVAYEKKNVVTQSKRGQSSGSGSGLGGRARSAISRQPSAIPDSEAEAEAEAEAEGSTSTSPPTKAKLWAADGKRRVSSSSSTSPSSAAEEDAGGADGQAKLRPDSKAKAKAKATSTAENQEDQEEGEQEQTQEQERIPTQMLSQKSKRKREKEEEEEVERRMAEMRRKMASGGGGKLGRRRLGR